MLGWFKWIPSLLGMALPSWVLPVSAVAGTLFVLGAAYLKGHHDAAVGCQAESLRAELRILKKDIAIQAAADKQESIAMERLDTENLTLKGKVKSYVDGLTTKCVYAPGDLERLRELRKGN